MKRLLIALLIAVALLAGMTTVRWLLLPPVVRAQFINTFCASNLACRAKTERNGNRAKTRNRANRPDKA